MGYQNWSFNSLLWCIRWPIDDLPIKNAGFPKLCKRSPKRAQKVEGAVILGDIGQNSSGIMDQSLSRPSTLLGYPRDPYHIRVNPLRKQVPFTQLGDFRYSNCYMSALQKRHPTVHHHPFALTNFRIQTNKTNIDGPSSSMMYHNIYLPSRWWSPKISQFRIAVVETPSRQGLMPFIKGSAIWRQSSTWKMVVGYSDNR